MSMKLMVLGVMYRDKQAHGYRVYHELVSWQAETWTNIRPGSIYHALTQLEKEGFLQNKGTKDGNRGSTKTTYAITIAGEHELKRLVEKALISYDQEQFTAGLAFMEMLTRQRATELAKKRLGMYRETVAFMKTLPYSDTPATPAQHSAIIFSWSAIFEATLKWQKRFVRDLESGKFTFVDES